MADHRRAGRNDEQPEQAIEPADAIPGHHDRAQQLCLDASRALALCGVLFATVPPADGAPAADAKLAFIGFLLWITGACLCLLALTPAAPRAVMAAASAVLIRCLPPRMN